MALNYSHRPLCPPHTSEDNLASHMRIVNGYFVEGNPDNCWEACGKSRHVRLGEIESRNSNFVRDRVDSCGSPESTSKDVIDLLPADPFGMDINTTVTAITGWLEDLHVDYGEDMRINKAGTSQNDYGLFVKWNLILNYASPGQPKADFGVMFPSCPATEESVSHCCTSSFQSAETLHASEIIRHAENDIGGLLNQHDFKLTQTCSVGDNVSSSCRIGSCSADMQTGEVDIMGSLNQHDFKLTPTCSAGEVVGLSSMIGSCSGDMQTEEVNGAAKFKSVAHEALSYSLAYLGVKELLSVERVNKSLYSEVRDDPSLWSRIHIDQPLNEKMTDDVLVQLASRAKGTLQCLSLVECLKVTVDGLGHILETNPQLTKLCVPGCTRLSVEGILNIIKAHNSREGVLGIKLIRIGGLNVVKSEHFEDLTLLLGIDGTAQSFRKPHYYRWGNVYIPCDDERAIDIEKCPRCEKFRMVYDCPAESCQAKDKTSLPCRACKICIPRCDQCGTCIDERVFEETFCLDVLCQDCYRQPVKFQGAAAYEADQLLGVGE